MSVKKIKEYIEEDWLKQHWDEFISMSGKITRTLIVSTAVEKKWKNPLKSPEDFKLFYEDEAKLKGLTATEIEFFFFEAGRLKARNYIFEKKCVPLLPKDDEGKCIYALEELLSFVNSTVNHEALLQSPK